MMRGPCGKSRSRGENPAASARETRRGLWGATKRGVSLSSRGSLKPPRRMPRNEPDCCAAIGRASPRESAPMRRCRRSCRRQKTRATQHRSPPTGNRRAGRQAESSRPRRSWRRGPGAYPIREDAEITELLRNLVCGRGNPRDDAHLSADHERRANGEAADEIVQTVSQQNQVSDRLFRIRFD